MNQRPRDELQRPSLAIQYGAGTAQGPLPFEREFSFPVHLARRPSRCVSLCINKPSVMKAVDGFSSLHAWFFHFGMQTLWEELSYLEVTACKDTHGEPLQKPTDYLFFHGKSWVYLLRVCVGALWEHMRWISNHNERLSKGNDVTNVWSWYMFPIKNSKRRLKIMDHLGNTTSVAKQRTESQTDFN